MTGERPMSDTMTRREWLHAGLRWGGVALAVGVAGVLALRSGRARDGARPVCSGCPRAGNGCSPKTGCPARTRRHGERRPGAGEESP